MRLLGDVLLGHPPCVPSDLLCMLFLGQVCSLLLNLRRARANINYNEVPSSPLNVSLTCSLMDLRKADFGTSHARFVVDSSHR